MAGVAGDGDRQRADGVGLVDHDQDRAVGGEFEVVGRRGPFKTLTEVEYALMEWCDWYNNARLHSRPDYLTPAEYEAAYHAQQPPRRPALV
ncbi:IS3 family transposase [Nocardia brevicatena]|uniref:IS3 family transposase n=1 Tax=Nocardia brevicatena TaxID=37327 RepID=UPI0002D38394